MLSGDVSNTSQRSVTTRFVILTILLIVVTIALNLYSNIGSIDYHSTKDGVTIYNPYHTSNAAIIRLPNASEHNQHISNTAAEVSNKKHLTGHNTHWIAERYLPNCSNSDIKINPIKSISNSSDNDSTMTPKYMFQIGLAKCGTATMERFFERNKIASIHFNFQLSLLTDDDDTSTLSKRALLEKQMPFQQRTKAHNFHKPPTTALLYELMCDNICNNGGNLSNGVFYPLDQSTTFFSNFNGKQATTKLNNHYLFEWIDFSYPNSIFIFNYRFSYKWMLSRTKWGTSLEKQWKTSFGHRPTNKNWISDVLELWYNQYWNLTCAVIDYFSIANIDNTNGGKLMLIDIETEGGNELTQKLKQWYPNLNASLWGHSHTTKTALYSASVQTGVRIIETTKKYAIRDNTALDTIQKHCNFSIDDPNFANIVF